MVAEVVKLTLEQKPKNATHWSTRSMAERSGLSQTAVSRIWRAFGLQPHREETFKISTDPLFVDRVRDVVGLYLNPPQCALVLCVDEKSQVQALDRSQPLLPMTPGSCERRTHDYHRHGVTSLFAPLIALAGAGRLKKSVKLFGLTGIESKDRQSRAFRWRTPFRREVSTKGHKRGALSQRPYEWQSGALRE